MLMTADDFVRLRNSTKPTEYERAANEEAADNVWFDVIRQHPDMRKWVAHNKTVSIRVLQVLAVDTDTDVRCMVATKNKLTPELFDFLSQDEYPGVRQRIACNKNCPTPILQKLSANPNGIVASAATGRLR